MKKLLVLGLLCASAQAGNYLSLEVLQSTISDTCDPWQEQIDAPATAALLYASGPYQSVTTSCNESDIGGRLAFGEQFSKTWGFELGYQSAGEVLMDIKGDGTSFAKMTLGMTAADLALTFRTPVYADIYFTGRVGAARWSIEFENNFDESKLKHSGTTAEYGIGAEWHWVTVGYNVISKVGFEDQDTRDVKQASIGARLKF